MEELLPLIQSGHRQMEQAIAEHLAGQQTAADAQELDGELAVGGIRVRVLRQPETEEDAAPRQLGPRTLKEQARFDAIVEQYRRCGLLIEGPEAVPDKPEESEPEPTPLEKAADEAREEYARRAANRGVWAISFGSRHNQASVAEARAEYERKKQDLLDNERATALAAGVDADMFDSYAPAAAAVEAHKLVKEISYAQKLASKRWLLDEDMEIVSSGKHYKTVPVLDTAHPLTKIKRVLFGKLWGEWEHKEEDEEERIWGPQKVYDDDYDAIKAKKREDEEKRKAEALKTHNTALGLRRAALVSGTSATLAAGVLLPPVGIGLIAAGSGWLAGKIAKKAIDYKPGYKPGRTVHRILSREAEYEEVLFSKLKSARSGTELEIAKHRRTLYNDAELKKDVAYALIHADPADETINNLDKTIADMIDEDADERPPINTSKLAFRLGATALAAAPYFLT